MKFMVSWCVHKDHRHEVLKTFSDMSDEEAADEFRGIKVIGRWHDLIGFTGIAIVETDDSDELNTWLIKWNHVVDLKILPVSDDIEARAFGRKVLA